MVFLRDNRYVCEVATSLVLMYSAGASDVLAGWVDARSKLPAHMESVVTWAPLLALGEAPPGGARATEVLKRGWVSKAALARRVASARRAAPDSPWKDWAPVEIGLFLLHASRSGREGPVTTADLRALSGKVGGPLDPAGGVDQDARRAGRWLLEQAKPGPEADESGLKEALVRSLGKPIELPRRWNVDPPCTALWCLGRTGRTWEPSTLDLVSRIASGRVEGARADDPVGWVRRVRAVEALAGQVTRDTSSSKKSRDTIRGALEDRDAPVRWTALCMLARSDARVAGSLGLPGPEAALRRVDALSTAPRKKVDISCPCPCP